MTVNIELVTDDAAGRGVISSFLATLVIDGIIGDTIDDVRIRTDSFVVNRRYIALKNIEVKPGDDLVDTLKRVLTKCPFGVNQITITLNK